MVQRSLGMALSSFYARVIVIGVRTHVLLRAKHRGVERALLVTGTMGNLLEVGFRLFQKARREGLHRQTPPYPKDLT